MSVSQLLLLQPTCLEVATHTLYQKKNHNLASGRKLSACFETPAVIGPCKAAFPRWTFENGVCRKFIYGGCGGNGNRFMTLSECKQKCVDEIPSEKKFILVENYSDLSRKSLTLAIK